MSHEILIPVLQMSQQSMGIKEYLSDVGVLGILQGLFTEHLLGTGIFLGVEIQQSSHYWPRGGCVWIYGEAR